MNKIISITPHWIKKTYIFSLILSKLREIKIENTYNQHLTPLPRKFATRSASTRTIHNPKTTVIYCINRQFNKLGLSDRLWGLISTYIISSNNGLPFKLLWTNPFDIREFLIPNNYDWNIDEEDVIFSRQYSKPLFVPNNHNEKNQVRLLQRMTRITKPQIHVYTNAHMERDKFGQYFNHLFKPTKLLQDRLDKEKENIGTQYISITFRFQQLLGDFKEGNYKVLSDEDAKELLGKAINTIKRVKDENPGIHKILVTSDSKRLLEEAQKLPYVYVSPGEVVHMGFSEKGKDMEKHLKSFVDFFMIADAQKVYFAYSKLIYRSTFAKTAASVYNRPYEEIEIS